jgi:hypothetical protein
VGLLGPLIATEPAQLLVWAKSPLVVTVRGVKTPAPVLVSVTVCGALVVLTFWFAKVRLVADSCTTGEAVIPVKLTDSGRAVPAVLTNSIPVPVPVAVGVKITWMLQLELGAKLAGQLLVCEKSPLTLTPVIT